MYEAPYYREQAARATRLSTHTTDMEVHEMLASAARDFDDIAEDLEKGAVEIRHPELMPQKDGDPVPGGPDN
jgi:hypothetical protein